MGQRVVQRGDEVYATRTVDVSHDGRSILVGRHAVRDAERLELVSQDDLRILEQWGNELGKDATFARFTQVDERLVVADSARQVLVIDRRSGAVQSIAEGCRAVAAARAAPRAVVVAERVVVFDTTNGEPLWNVSETHPTTRDATAVALSADGSQLAVAGWEGGGIAVLDVESRGVSTVIPWSSRGTQFLAFHPQGRYLAIAGPGGCAAWEIPSAARVAAGMLNETKAGYTCHAFHPTLPRILLGARSGYLSMIDLESSAWIYAEKVHEGRVWEVAVADDGSVVASAGDEGDVYLQTWRDLEDIGHTRTQ